MLRRVALNYCNQILYANGDWPLPNVNPNSSGWFYYDPEKMSDEEARQRLLECVIKRYDKEIEAKQYVRSKLKGML